MKSFFKINNQKGDTMIEVLLSIAIIGVALGTGYALTNRSFHRGVGAGERAAAVALAQGQVDFIKDSYLSSNVPEKAQMLNDYKGAPAKFCISTTGAVLPQSQCANFAGSINTIAINYAADGGVSTGGTFAINASWESTNNNQNQTTLYYKVPK